VSKMGEWYLENVPETDEALPEPEYSEEEDGYQESN